MASHGTHAGYYCLPCRTPDTCPGTISCTEAAARYERRRIYLKDRGVELRVDVTGARRRVQALRALGWTDQHIAAAAGLPSAFAVSQAVQGGGAVRRYLYRRTHDAIVRAYAALSDRDGPSDRNRKRAVRFGWAPPIAWDYDTIDNPDAPPYGGQDVDVDPVVVERILAGDWRLPATRAERLAVLAACRVAGVSTNELERLTGWNVRRDERETREAAEHAVSAA